MLPKFFQLAKKEIDIYFSSLSAFLFLGGYLAVTLFMFFWVETFLARNIADVRPLFEWMPVLLAFLCPALTMKMWSEEKRTGTLEFLMTKPAGTLRLVMAKFIAALGLIAIALSLTIFIPCTVSWLGNLDWGPVGGGYVATFFLAAAYLAIGLMVSANSENQIVSLIVSTIFCLSLYLVGTDAVTSFFAHDVAEVMRLFATGARFKSISKGVLDVRDLYYYLSIIVIALSANVYSLEKIRWFGNKKSKSCKVWRQITFLLIINCILSNLWMNEIKFFRLDLTQGKIYSISSTSKKYISQLQEPLLIRGYFSSRTHPLLAPLVPQLKNLLEEYAIAGSNKLTVEIIDPQLDQEAEVEAVEKYGIKPVPFQMADKYQSSLVNSYFNVIVQYGDQHEVLGFRDLIEINASYETEIEVTLRNPEYEITRSIKKVAQEYQDDFSIYSKLSNPLEVKAYISDDEKLPKKLIDFKKNLVDFFKEEEINANSKLLFTVDDPQRGDKSIEKEINQQYGFQPLRSSLLNDNKFYFHLLLKQKDKLVQVAIPESLNKMDLRSNFEAGLKRFSPGGMKVVAMYKDAHSKDTYHGMHGQENKFTLLKQKLEQNFHVIESSFESGSIPAEADILLITKPKELAEKQIFAIDQFLMQGGTIILATSPFSVSFGDEFVAEKISSGLEGFLQHNGITIEESMVLDPNNSRIAIPFTRDIGGLKLQDYHMLSYPYFVDIRKDGMNKKNILTSGIEQLTFSWGSPIVVQDNKNLLATRLLTSSNSSWNDDSLNVVPKNIATGFSSEKEKKREQHVLGLVLEGGFSSYFQNKDLTKLFKEQYKNIINQSPPTGRIILYSSNEFLSDDAIRLASMVSNDLYLNSIQLLENSIDWSLEDNALLSIRSRGNFIRTLMPMSVEEKVIWEYVNYALGVFVLLIVYFVKRFYTKRAYHRKLLTFSKGA